MVTIALASLLIGNVFLGRKKIPLQIVGMVLGAFVFRLVYTIALRFDIVSSVIVVLAISIPYLKTRFPFLKRRIDQRFGRRTA